MNSLNAYNLTLQTGVSNLKLEKIISQDYSCSWRYAFYVLKGRFELGEEEISENSNYAYDYAIRILKVRFELGEEAISKDCHYSWNYALCVMKGRFELGEETIMNSYYACDYLVKVLGYNHE